MRIAIGSANPVKCNASQAVLAPLFPHAEFVAMTVPSGIAAQPWGDQETRTGALNRARMVLQDAQADLGVGLEGGVQSTELGLFTCAWAAIVDKAGRIGVGGNSCVMLPPSVAEMLQNGNELGTAMDQIANQHNTRQHNGAIGILTKELETRQSAYEHILRLAMAPFQHPDWYPISSSSD